MAHPQLLYFFLHGTTLIVNNLIISCDSVGTLDAQIMHKAQPTDLLISAIHYPNAIAITL